MAAIFSIEKYKTRQDCGFPGSHTMQVRTRTPTFRRSTLAPSTGLMYVGAEMAWLYKDVYKRCDCQIQGEGVKKVTDFSQ